MLVVCRSELGLDEQIRGMTQLEQVLGITTRWNLVRMRIPTFGFVEALMQEQVRLSSRTTQIVVLQQLNKQNSWPVVKAGGVCGISAFENVLLVTMTGQLPEGELCRI